MLRTAASWRTQVMTCEYHLPMNNTVPHKLGGTAALLVKDSRATHDL